MQEAVRNHIEMWQIYVCAIQRTANTLFCLRHRYFVIRFQNDHFSCFVLHYSNLISSPSHETAEVRRTKSTTAKYFANKRTRHQFFLQYVTNVLY